MQILPCQNLQQPDTDLCHSFVPEYKYAYCVSRAFGLTRLFFRQEISNVRRGPPPAAKEEVEKLSITVVTSSVLARLGEDTHCAVCREPLVLGDNMQEMPCQHPYHLECLRPWLVRFWPPSCILVTNPFMFASTTRLTFGADSSAELDTHTVPSVLFWADYFCRRTTTLAQYVAMSYEPMTRTTSIRNN